MKWVQKKNAIPLQLKISYQNSRDISKVRLKCLSEEGILTAKITDKNLCQRVRNSQSTEFPFPFLFPC